MSVDTAPTQTNAPSTLRGQCLCGAVRYAVANAFRYAFNCHCSQCRRATGSAFKPFAGIESEALRLTAGEEQTLVYGDPQAAHDVHCGRCGSLLYSVVREGAYVHVTLGTLADTPDIRPTGHLFVRSKAPWFEIADSLPQYDEFPP
ncbi:MAG TPA: GFA family protein [Paraburkholderia sp.]|nr:GFA family protein [Paraburkholderia sp.]